jgi:hypothetical protein
MGGDEPEDEAAADDKPETVVDRPVSPSAKTVVTPAGEADAPVRDSSPSLAGASLGAGTTTSFATARGAADLSEIARTRTFCYFGIALALAAAPAVLLLPGGYWTTRIFMAGILSAALGLGYLIYRTTKPETFHVGIGASIGWFIPVIAVTTAIPFFGAMSPAPILLILGIFFNGLAGTRGVAIATYVSCALVQGVTGGLVGAGVIDDPGFIHPAGLAPVYQLICQGLIQLIFFGTFFNARATAKSSLAALGELEKAVRAVAHREALLEEARADLRRALGSNRGRFTDQLIGNYQLGDLIGHGAMGEVYQGVDTRDNTQVAVKMLSRASLGNTQHVERFLRELQTTISISSPNVVRVLAVGEHPLPHLVMERLRGRDLSALMKSRGPFEAAAVIDLVRQVAEGLAAATEAGIVHRDIKPQNLFLSGTTWKILDFGVSRILASADTLTGGHIIGTPAYMAPEQARGAKVDHRSDIYSLAAVAYRAITGKAIFKTGEVADTLYKVVHTAPRRPSWIRTLPTDVDFALALGLAKKPQDRFASAHELADALEAAFGAGLSPALRQRAASIKDPWEEEEASTRK